MLKGRPYDKEIDVRGMDCPIPIIQASREMIDLPPNQVLKIVSSETCSLKDVKEWTGQSKNLELVTQDLGLVDGEEIYAHYIRRKF